MKTHSRDLDWDYLNQLRQDALVDTKASLEQSDRERAGYDAEWLVREAARRREIERRARELIDSGKTKPMGMNRATGVISMAEYRKRHPQRFSEQIREGLAFRRKTDPDFHSRGGRKGRATSMANGYRPGPTKEQVASAAEMRAQGMSWQKIADQLGQASGNTVRRWITRGIAKCNR